MKRIYAFFYDFLLCVGMIFLATYLALFVHQGRSFRSEDTYLWCYIWAVLGLYFTVSWHKSGQTVGLLAWHLKIVHQNGKLMGFKKAWLRYVLATLSLFFLGLGFLFALCNSKKLYWHDWVLKLQIIKAEK